MTLDRHGAESLLPEVLWAVKVAVPLSVSDHPDPAEATMKHSPRTRCAPNTAVQINALPTSSRSVELPVLRRRTCSVDAVHAWPGRMRRAALEVLREWGLHGLADDVQLVVSELATNAILHTTAPVVTVRLSLRESAIRVEVAAPASELPMPAPTETRPEAERGRGLWLVENIASRWERSRCDGLVWCEISFRQVSSKPVPQQALTFVRTELPPSIERSLVQARTFVRATATTLGWRGDVESAAHATAEVVRSAADGVRHPFWLGLAVDVEGSLRIEVEDDRDGFEEDDSVVRRLQEMSGAHVSWSPAPGGRIVRAVVPVQRVVRVGGAA